jgi:heme exporter protein CcmB
MSRLHSDGAAARRDAVRSPTNAPAPPGLLRQALLLVAKDVRIELRAKELLYSTVLFALVVLLIFSFAFFGGERPTVDVVAGLLWVATALAGTVGISRAFEREREGDTLRALLLSPAPREAIYLSKLVSITLLMLIVELTAALAIGLLYSLDLFGSASRLLALLLLGTVGFAGVAALFGAALGRARSRDVLLPLLTWPLVVPVLIAGTRGTVALWRGDEGSVVSFWLRFLGVFDLLFISTGLWLFAPVTRGEGT